MTSLVLDERQLFSDFLGVVARRLARATREDTLRAPAGERCWRRVLSTTTYDAWLVAWAPGTGLPEHDHGASTAAFEVIRGELVERSRDDASHRPRVRVLGAGAIATVPAGRRHEVTNASTGQALSLHVYAPPLGDTWKP